LTGNNTSKEICSRSHAPPLSSPPPFDQSGVGRLEFVHIPKAGGTAIELATARENNEWGAFVAFMVTWVHGVNHARISCNINNNNNNKRRKGPTRFPLPYKKRHVHMTSRWHFRSHYHHDDSDDNNPIINSTLFAAVHNPYDKIIRTK
jgi:hypothetical protein